MHRVWLDATPRYADQGSAPSANSAQAVTTLLEAAQLPANTQLAWVGVDLTIQNTGQSSIELGRAGGPGADSLWFVVNGRGPLLNANRSADLLESGWEFGVLGCGLSVPAGATLDPGGSIGGCVALAVPVGTAVASVGLDLQPVTGGPVQQVAQWAV
jgi:hypothetical protein